MAELGFELRKMRKLIDYFLAEAIFFFSEVGVGDTTVPEKKDLKRESRKGSLVGAVNLPAPGSAGHRGSPMTMN